MSNDPRGAIGFAEKVLELLDEGRYTSTYKFAVLLALLDLCLEGTQASGAPPEMVTTRQLALKVVELYWPHSVPFVGRSPGAVLRQNNNGQAEIVTTIRNFRQQHAADPSVPHWESRMAAPTAYARLVKKVEWKLIEMPLPRLQTMGHAQREFIYRIAWDTQILQGDLVEYLDGAASSFDNRVLLLPYVGEYLVQLNGLLRPLIQRRWTAMIAHVNRLEESQLEVFLFGASRTPTARVRAGLWEIQEKRCFYCEARIADPAGAEVDHFVPWARYADDGLDNFVVADTMCNGSKSSSLAADAHLSRWTRRFVQESTECDAFTQLAAKTRWVRDPGRSLSVARAIYPRLPHDARLWLRGREFVPPHTSVIAKALAVQTLC